MSLNKSIVKWIKYDDNIKKYNNDIKEIRTKKNDLENDIINHLINNKLTDNIYQITDINTKIELNTTKEYENISYKYLLDCFLGFFKNNSIQGKSTIDISNDLLNYIKENRHVKKKEFLKRQLIKTN